MSYGAPQITLVATVELLVAIALFSHSLPRRDGTARLAAVTCGVLALTGVAVRFGYSVFPPLTDAASFFRAILTFITVLAVSVCAHQLAFDCPRLTSLFCCSMAYSLQSMTLTVERVSMALLPTTSYPVTLASGLVRTAAVCAVVYVLADFLFIHRIEKAGLLQIDNPILALTAALAIIVNMVLDLVLKDLAMFEVPAHYQNLLLAIYLLLCVYIMYSTYEVVYNRRLIANVQTMDRMRTMLTRQYEVSRENIEAINLRCHYVRSQIRALEGAVDKRTLDELGREVDLYDSVVKTGNDALDTILTEKSLICEKNDITFGCVVDGPALNFMDPIDLYTFFGTAIDNAIEAVGQIDDTAHRSISLVVQRRGLMVSIHLENYFDGDVHFGSENLPLAQHGERYGYGFGTRSMRHVVESYDGTLSSMTQGNIFHLNAPVPAA